LFSSSSGLGEQSAGDAGEHGAAAFDEDAEDGSAAAAGTLKGLLSSMVGATGELTVNFTSWNI
jgi:hypothetical protein